MQRRNAFIGGVTVALAALARLPSATGSEYYEEDIKASASPYIKGAAPFNEIENVSLVSLYNPKENAELDCYFFSCLKDETSMNRVLVRGLLCASSPIALEQGKQPFTQEEFTRIETAEAFVRSSAPPVPIFYVVAAAAAPCLDVFEISHREEEPNMFFLRISCGLVIVVLTVWSRPQARLSSSKSGSSRGKGCG
ncbi:hypothetical protein Emag_001809 [Eimeria magna]